MEFKQIVRIKYADIKGEKPIYNALTRINGISYSYSNAICSILNFDKNKKVGSLTPEEIQKIEDLIKNPLKYKVPVFLLNRRKDRETGQDIHLTVSDLKLKKEFDIKHLKIIKSYRGIRHALGLPVRGQKTKGHFRKGKSIGVTGKAKRGKKS